MKVLPFISIIAFLCGAHALACKELIYPAHLGKEVLDAYDTIAVVRINEVTSLAESSRYAPPFKFSGLVVRAIKGPFKNGDAMFGQTGGKGLGCPIQLSVGTSYLLFFFGTKNPVTLARYDSYYRRLDDPKTDGYVKDLEALCPMPNAKN